MKFLEMVVQQYKRICMKNIHIIPTDKPSRLHFDSKLFISPKIQLRKSINSIVGGRNIYITSDENVKDSEYGICLNLVKEGFKAEQAVFKMDTEQRYSMEFLGGQEKAQVFKVILTTDQNLIKDSVQPIDNEFLQWFVNNPDCEEVKVKRGKMKLNVDGEEYGFPDMSLYKIIIPEKESKQVCEHDIVTKYGVVECQNCGIEESEILKAKQMYSEEEVYDIVSKTVNQLQLHFSENLKNQIIDELFKQFKK